MRFPRLFSPGPDGFVAISGLTVLGLAAALLAPGHRAEEGSVAVRPEIPMRILPPDPPEDTTVPAREHASPSYWRHAAPPTAAPEPRAGREDTPGPSGRPLTEPAAPPPAAPPVPTATTTNTVTTSTTTTSTATTSTTTTTTVSMTGSPTVSTTGSATTTTTEQGSTTTTPAAEGQAGSPTAGPAAGPPAPATTTTPVVTAVTTVLP